MRFRFLSFVTAALLASGAAFAADAPAPGNASFDLSIKDHVFVPKQLAIPADKQVKLTVKNLDPTPAEFESEDFQVEKVVPANGEVSLYIGPLKAGSYGFYDDFHEDSTKGTLLVQ